jgi:drug/metabolite transporter (DMT)-like permease
MAALMAIPALGELPTSIDWLAIGMIAAGVYLASGAPVPGLSTMPSPRERGVARPTYVPPAALVHFEKEDKA